MSMLTERGFHVGDIVELTEPKCGRPVGTRVQIVEDDGDLVPSCRAVGDGEVDGKLSFYVDESCFKKVDEDDFWFISVLNPKESDLSGTYGSNHKVVKGKDNAVKEAERLAAIFYSNTVKIGQFSHSCKHNNIVWDS